MLKLLLLVLSVQPPFIPNWFGLSPDPAGVDQFVRDVQSHADDVKPTSPQQWTCFWAAHVLESLKAYRGPRTQDILDAERKAREFLDKNCGDPDTHKRWFLFMTRGLERKGVNGPTTHRVVEAPVPLPPLPDRAGKDLGGQLWVMFQALEVRLASGGHKLSGEGRACAWVSAALSGAEAVQRTPAATSGIGAGVGVLQTKRTATCRGEALAQKEAAWAWLRANPQATQPLEVARRSPSAGWPVSPEDPYLWVGAAVLFSVAPEAAPVLLLAR